MSAGGEVLRVAEARQQRAVRPATSVWVGASAGCGKTKVLTDRVLALLLAGTAPTRVLCLTFTKAAAAEMRIRINDQLGAWATFADDALAAAVAPLVDRAPAAADLTLARQLFARVLDAPGGMKIMTIHGFCQSVLQRFPLEAGVAPHFAVMAERDSAEMLELAKAEMLTRARAGVDAAVGEPLAIVTRRVHEVLFPELMTEVVHDRGRLERLIDQHDGVDGLIAAVYRTVGVTPAETPEAVVAAACADGAFDVRGLAVATAALRDGSKVDKERAGVITEWLRAEPKKRADGFDGYAAQFITRTTGKVRDTLITRKAHDLHPGADSPLLAEGERLLAVLVRRRQAVMAQATAALLRLTDTLLAIYGHRKAARALLDYDDLILLTRNLLRRPGIAPWVLFKLDGGLDHLLIDEAQDTNPEQWEVVAALTGEFFAGAGDIGPPRTVFAVGDGKQSIYSFQRADPAAFEHMRAHFRARVAQGGQAWDDVDLDVSFRSTAAVLEAVDAVFAGVPARHGVVADNTVVHHLAHRQGEHGRVELWPPLKPQAAEAPAPWKPPVERVSVPSARVRLTRLVARRIARWLDDGAALPSRGRAIGPGDIMILVRRRGEFVNDMVRALKDLGVPVAGVDRMVLAEQLAVMDLMALGAFLLLPEDDLTLATVLKGPLVGLTETQLFDVAHGREGRLWRTLAQRAGEAEAYGRAHALLERLLRRVDFVRPYELYAEVLNQGGMAQLMARLGPDAEDPIEEFLSQALAYERTNTPSLQGFLHWIGAGQVEVVRDLEQGRGQVRVMTVHGAKGLQAPIVILPDTMQQPEKMSRLLWPADQDIVLWGTRVAEFDDVAAAAYEAAKQARTDEYRRLLYVAMTRAEDRLYVCGWETERTAPADCWYHLIGDGLADIAQPAAEPLLAAAGGDGDATVLRLESPQRSPAAAPAAVEAAAAAAVPAWTRAAPRPEPVPPRPLAPSRTPHEAAEPALRSPVGGDGGARFYQGRLVHQLLQHLPTLPAGARAAACHGFLARPVHGLDAPTQATLAAEVLAVLEDPTFAALFGPGSQAEVPVAGILGAPAGAQAELFAGAARAGPQVVSGQIDRLVVTADQVLVVDYKTTRPPPATAAETAPSYLRQMAAYRALIRQIFPDKTTLCALLWTDGPRLMALPDAVLDAHAP